MTLDKAITDLETEYEDKIIEWKKDFKEYVNSLSMLNDDYKGIMEYIDELPVTPQPKYNTSEWCHDCKEYDHGKHCCPRYNRVIRKAVEEMKQESCEDAISRDEVCRYVAEFVNHEFSTREEEELIDNIITGIEHLPPVTPKPKVGHLDQDQEPKQPENGSKLFGNPEKMDDRTTDGCISRADVEQTVEDNILCYTHSDRPMDQDPDTECHMAIRTALRMLKKDLRKLPPVTPQPQTGHWIPVKFRPLTDEEQEEYPDYCYMADCPMPDDGEEILVSTKYGRVEKDECGFDDGCYLDSGYDWQTDIVAWMPLPKHYEPQESEKTDADSYRVI